MTRTIVNRCADSRSIIFALVLLVTSSVSFAAETLPKRDFVKTIDQLLYEDNFDNDLSNWRVEQVAGGKTSVNDGWLEIDDAGGCTVWFKHKLTAPVLIEYDVMMVRADGKNDNVRDLNCFWMANDPKHPDDIFANADKRGGRFPNYHNLKLYYVGFGGSGNKTTRFRRYPGTGERPLLPEHDLGTSRYLLQANARMRIQLVVAGNRVQYIRNGEVIFDINDPEPYHAGYFGFRTVSNHMKIDSFRVYRLNLEQNKPSDDIASLIQRAGNADTDEERLALLKQLRSRTDLEPSLQADADKLIAEIDKWINSKILPYCAHAVRDGNDYDYKIDESSLLFPLLHLYQGRALTWYANEMGGVWGYPDRRRHWMDKARLHFVEAQKYFPQNKLARLYLGEKIPSSKTYAAVTDAPEWAVYQRESLERLTDIVEWWIDHRQQPDGSFGGGWGDDCEMWRSWVPVMIPFDNPKITQSQSLLTNAIMSQPHMKGGYTSHMSDVQHTSEDSADTLTPMMLLEPDNPKWSKMALRLAELTETFWTGINERGHRQFKSTYFTSDQIDETPLRACDTFTHCRTVQPALLYWQRTGDEGLTKLFTEWMDTWVDAAARAERGKPAGVIPSAIHWPDGQAGGTTAEWWDPRHYNPPSIYRWPSAMRWMTQSLLLTYHMTDDEKYLAPLRSMAAIRLKYLKAPVAEPEPGSEAWCAAQMGSLISTFAKYQFLTGREDFNELLNAERSAYVNFRLQGDRKILANALDNLAYILRYNVETYTSEVRWTDRVFTFPRLLGANGLWPEPMSNNYRPDLDLLYATTTGDPGDVGYFPINAVRWMTSSREIAVLVTNASNERLEAELFHFGDSSRPMAAELYLLAEGEYEITLTSDGPDESSKPLVKQLFRVEGTKARVKFELPSQRLCRLAIRPKK